MVICICERLHISHGGIKKIKCKNALENALKTKSIINSKGGMNY